MQKLNLTVDDSTSGTVEPQAESGPRHAPVNAVRCLGCNAVLVSRHRHDFVTCACGVFVDGGSDYKRRGWPGGEWDGHFEELETQADVDAALAKVRA